MTRTDDGRRVEWVRAKNLRTAIRAGVGSESDRARFETALERLRRASVSPPYYVALPPGAAAAMLGPALAALERHRRMVAKALVGGLAAGCVLGIALAEWLV